MLEFVRISPAVCGLTQFNPAMRLSQVDFFWLCAAPVSFSARRGFAPFVLTQ
jgi:hypothetical protein